MRGKKHLTVNISVDIKFTEQNEGVEGGGIFWLNISVFDLAPPF